MNGKLKMKTRTVRKNKIQRINKRRTANKNRTALKIIRKHKKQSQVDSKIVQESSQIVQENLLETKQTSKICKDSQLQKGRKMKIAKSLISVASIALAVTLSKMIPSYGLKVNDIVDNSKTVVNIEMNTESKQLDYEIQELAIEINNKNNLSLDVPAWLTNGIQTKVSEYTVDGGIYTIEKEMRQGNFSISDNTVYMQYINENNTASKELVLTTKQNVNTDLLKRVSLRFKEKSTPTKIQTAANSFDSTQLILTETLAGGVLNENSLQANIIDIESTIKEANTYDGIELNFKELGSIQLPKDTKIEFNTKDNILKVINTVNNEVYFYVSFVNNENIGCRAEDLIATTNDKLFIHLDYDNKNGAGYKTFAIKTDTQLYCFRLNEIEESTRLFKQLDIELDNVEIKKIQRVIEGE